MLLAIGAFALIFYMTRTMIERNITNHSLEKKKSAPLWFVWRQNNFLSLVFALKMDKFVLKVKPKKKPCSITPQEQAKQYPEKFHTDNNLLFCSTCNVLVDHHRKSVLDKHLSAVSHIKRMNESSSKRGNNRNWRLHSSAKLQLTKISRKRWTLNYYCVKANIYRWSINAY